MNKAAAAVLAVAMLVPMAMPASAIEGASESTIGQAKVTYKVTEGYTWSIHADIDFGKDAGVKKTVDKEVDMNDKASKVTVTKNTIGDQKKLVIKVAGEDVDEFVVKNGSTKLNYKIIKTGEKKGENTTALTSGGENIGVNGTVLELDAGTNTGEASLKFTLFTTDSAAETAGEYNDELTYTASIENQQP